MPNNPLITRYQYSLLRPRQFWTYLVSYGIVLIMMLFLNFTIAINDGLTKEELATNLFIQFFIVEVLVCCILASYNSGSAIINEVKERSYDFFRLLPLSAFQKATGILFGKNIIVGLLAVLTLIPLLWCGLLTTIHPMFQLHLYVMLFSVVIVLNTGTLLSSFSMITTRRTQTGLYLVFAFFGIPWLLGGIGALANTKQPEAMTTKFFVFDVPLLPLISAIILYIGIWQFIGILRKFTNERDPLFTRKGAILFFIGVEIIAFGFFYTHLFQFEYAAGFMLLTLCVMTLLPFGAQRSFDDYLEFCGIVRAHGLAKKTMLSLLSYSHLSAGLLLLLIWFVCTIPVILISGSDWSVLVVNLALMASVLFVFLLSEINVLYKPTVNNIVILLGIIVGAYLLVPLILSAATGIKAISMFAPFGMFAELMEEHPIVIMPQVRVLAYNLALCIIPAALIFKRYRTILSIRKQLNNSVSST